MIVSYLDSSINKKPLATVNKLLELKYYATVLPNALKWYSNYCNLYVDITQSERNIHVKCQIQKLIRLILKMYVNM